MPDIVQLIKADHEKVKKMFKAFEEAGDTRSKQQIMDELLGELEVHASLEEEIFYPAMRRMPDMKEHIAEADEEHHVAKMLMSELRDMKASDSHWEAKFMVLMENVQHHIKEEEKEVLPKVKEDGTSDMANRLGERWEEAKGRSMEMPATLAAGDRRRS